jgi:hypothetical protein
LVAEQSNYRGLEHISDDGVDPLLVSHIRFDQTGVGEFIVVQRKLNRILQHFHSIIHSRARDELGEQPL